MMPFVLELPALKRSGAQTPGSDAAVPHPIVPLLRKNRKTNEVSHCSWRGPLKGWAEKVKATTLYPYQTRAFDLDAQTASALLVAVKTCKPQSMRQLHQRVTGLLWTTSFLFPEEYMFSEQTLTFNNLHGMLESAPNMAAKQPLKSCSCSCSRPRIQFVASLVLLRAARRTRRRPSGRRSRRTGNQRGLVRRRRQPEVPAAVLHALHDASDVRAVLAGLRRDDWRPAA